MRPDQKWNLQTLMYRMMLQPTDPPGQGPTLFIYLFICLFVFENTFYFIYFLSILLIMLLQFSQFFLFYPRLCPESPTILPCSPLSFMFMGCTYKFFSFKDLFFFLEGEGEREEEKQQCVVASCAPPIGDPACSPGMCPDWESNWQPFGSQASA